jgi:hypothetical protein
MEHDLFAVFPDLPWTRARHPPTRDWRRLPPPPRSRSVRAARRALIIEPETTATVTLHRILAVALNERTRLRTDSPGRRALDRIIQLTRAATE